MICEALSGFPPSTWFPKSLLLCWGGEMGLSFFFFLSLCNSVFAKEKIIFNSPLQRGLPLTLKRKDHGAVASGQFRGGPGLSNSSHLSSRFSSHLSGPQAAETVSWKCPWWWQLGCKDSRTSLCSSGFPPSSVSFGCSQSQKALV